MDGSACNGWGSRVDVGDIGSRRILINRYLNNIYLVEKKTVALQQWGGETKNLPNQTSS